MIVSIIIYYISSMVICLRSYDDAGQLLNQLGGTGGGVEGVVAGWAGNLN